MPRPMMPAPSTAMRSTDKRPPEGDARIGWPDALDGAESSLWGGRSQGVPWLLRRRSPALASPLLSTREGHGAPCPRADMYKVYTVYVLYMPRGRTPARRVCCATCSS